MAHSIFGTAQTINSSNYIYFLSLQKVIQLNHEQVTEIFTGNYCWQKKKKNHYLKLLYKKKRKKKKTNMLNLLEELINLHRGQGLDLYWRDTLNCPTEEEYLDMVMNSKFYIFFFFFFILINSIQNANQLLSFLIETGGLYRLAVRLMQELSSVEM